VAAGELGELKMASLRMSNRIWVPTELLSWGGQTTVAWWLGAHVADLACWLFQDRVARVYAVAGRGVLAGRGLDTPDFFHSILEFRGGAVAHLDNCWILGDAMPAVIDFQVMLVGAEGTMYADCSHNLSSQKYTHETAAWPNPLVVVDSHGTLRGFATESIRYFAHCLLNGTAPLVTLEEAVHNTEVLAAIHESAQQGQPVAVASD
jgi:predicted dehydrogenase